jgi:twitching motility protein PilT
MQLETFIDQARQRGASDLHLEAGQPATFRIRGRLVPSGAALDAAALEAMARALLLGDAWDAFVVQRSADLARTFCGVRCRVNVLTTARGVGLAVRLFVRTRPTIERLNLHPDLRRFARAPHGLVLVSGATGCGKSTTLAALIEEMNDGEPRHIVTLEAPIEYHFRPRRAFIRQREVGRDTPSFEQGLLDALREDPDVLLVGEMRDPSTMRLVLGAAETGHLVLATLHSGSCAEALARLVMAFPAEGQAGVCAQLGDSLIGAVCQRLVYRADLDLRVPECEVLVATSGVRGIVRQGAFSKLASAIEAGGADGMFTFERYAAWLSRKGDFVRDDAAPVEPDELDDAKTAPLHLARTVPVVAAAPSFRDALPVPPPRVRARPAKAQAPVGVDASDERKEGVIEIPAMDESAADILRDLEKR